MNLEDLNIDEDFGGRSSEIYSNKCKCGKVYELSTQKDEFPEYYTSVYVKCDCGRSVGFVLPVN